MILRRVVQRFRIDSVVVSEAFRHRLRQRIDVLVFDEFLVVHVPDLGGCGLSGFIMVELTEFCPVKVICLPVLVEDPSHLVRVAGVVDRKFESDESIDRLAVHFSQVEQLGCAAMVDEASGWVPLERHGDDVALIAAGGEFSIKVGGKDFGPLR